MKPALHSFHVLVKLIFLFEAGGNIVVVCYQQFCQHVALFSEMYGCIQILGNTVKQMIDFPLLKSKYFHLAL